MGISSSRLQVWAKRWPLAVVVLAALASMAWAQTSGIVRIEEDWEMVIGVPSANSDAPQVTCLISPLGNVDSYHATFIVNHHDVPSFVAGGLQLQVWNGEKLVASKRFPNQAVLAQPGETIRWTQVMRMTPDGLVFEVVAGTSQTWGAFGDENTLSLTVPMTPSDLSGYDPDVSVHQSGVSYAANRVQSLVLKRVRAYSAAGTSVEDTTSRVVHTLDK
jgi:hypothetical protein